MGKKSNYCVMCGLVKDTPLFAFPRNPSLRNEWKKFCQISFDRSTMRMCAKHFSEEDILKSSIRIRLKSGALPQFMRNKIVMPSRPKSNNNICFLCDVKDPNRTYFRFPKALDRRWEWLKICGYPSLEDAKGLGKHTFLCEIHFRKEDIRERMTENGKSQLQPNSIPRLHLKNTIFDSDDEDPKPNNTDPVPVENECPFEIVTVTVIEEESEQEIPSVEQEPTFRDDEHNKTNENTANSSTLPNSRRRKRMKYIGDIKEIDFQSPEKAQKAFQVAKDEVLKCRQKIRRLRRKVQSLTQSVNKYKSIIDDLKKEEELGGEWWK